MDVKQLIGLDIGKARSGIARASAVARLAEPFSSVETSKLIPELQKLIKENSVDVIVVGLPRGLSGDETSQTQWVRRWVADAKSKVSRPFYWQDEALTTQLAEARAAAHKRPQDPDALAAAIVLQDFLDTPEAERVVC